MDVGTLGAAPTGVGVYVRELGRALQELEPELIRFIGVKAGSPFDDTSSGGGTHPRPPLREGGRYIPWVERRSERDARTVEATLVHYSSAIAPVAARLPYVVTVFDLSVLRDPLHHPPLRLARVLWMLVAVRRARLVIVPSESTRRDVVRGLFVPADKVVVVPLASSKLLEPGQRDGDGAILARHGVEAGGYVLAAGGLDGRKNTERLVRAVYRLRGADAALKLVICGVRGFRAGLIEAAIREVDVDGRVIVAGYVDDEELDALMRNAAVFSFVSLHEGFGLPILEAMSAGTPVVTSRISSMPEVAGGAAVLVDPRDVDDIGRGIGEAVARRDELSPAGIARARARTWHDVANETLAVYRRALR